MGLVGYIWSFKNFCVIHLIPLSTQTRHKESGRSQKHFYVAPQPVVFKRELGHRNGQLGERAEENRVSVYGGFRQWKTSQKDNWGFQRTRSHSKFSNSEYGGCSILESLLTRLPSLRLFGYCLQVRRVRLCRKGHFFQLRLVAGKLYLIMHMCEALIEASLHQTRAFSA